MNIPLLIYIIGYVVSFIMGRYLIRRMYKINNCDYDWIAVWFNIILSFASIIALFSWVIIGLLELSSDFKLKEPPKWL